MHLNIYQLLTTVQEGVCGAVFGLCERIKCSRVSDQETLSESHRGSVHAFQL